MIARTFFSTCLALFLGGCTLVGIRTAEEAPYTVLSQHGDIELRQYGAYVTVETEVEADFKNAGNRAFGKLFAYISGDNQAKQSIDMTAPVISRDVNAAGESIDMTAPVIATSSREGWRYAFVLPAAYTLDNAPAPLRDDLELVSNPPRRVAVLRFSGSWQQAAYEKNVERLQDWLSANQHVAVSAPGFAGYDPPWTLPFLRRNEVLIEIDR